MEPTNLLEIYQCGCRPSFVYKTRQTYQHHFQNTCHRLWQALQDLQHARGQAARLENQIASLRVEKNMWKDMAIRLKQRYEPDHILD